MLVATLAKVTLWDLSTCQVTATSSVIDAPPSEWSEDAVDTMPLGGFIPDQNKIVVDTFEKLQLAEEVLFGDGRGLPKAVGSAAHLRLVGVDCEVKPKTAVRFMCQTKSLHIPWAISHQ
eukprot:1179266-Prorocentrum_minimum.AAC.7